MPSLPVLVLGASNESPCDYAGERITFLSRPLLPGQVVSLASKLLANERQLA
jgi:hypothetical protein